MSTYNVIKWFGIPNNKVVYQAQLERYQLAKEKFENNLIDYFEFTTYQNQLNTAELEIYFNKEILRMYQW